MMTVSYVVPCFNCGKYIVECLSSILKQCDAEVELEIVIVDDGSSDNSVELTEEFIASHPEANARLIFHPDRINKGVSATRVMGLSHTHGEYVCFLDADDYLINQHKTLLQLNEFQADPSLVMVHTAVEVTGDETSRQAYTSNFEANCSKSAYVFSCLDDCLTSNHVCNSTVMVKRSALEQVFFDSHQCFQYEDWALWLLLSQQGKFKCLACKTIAYRLHDKSATTLVSRNKLRHYYSTIECKLIVLTRAGFSILGIKILLSLRHDIIALLSIYSRQGASGAFVPKRSRLLAVILAGLLSPVAFGRKILSSRFSLGFTRRP